MPYLFDHNPMCAVAGCGFGGRYDVRSGLMSRQPNIYPLPEPRCKRHARELYAWYEQEERRAATATPSAGEG